MKGALQHDMNGNNDNRVRGVAGGRKNSVPANTETRCMQQRGGGGGAWGVQQEGATEERREGRGRSRTIKSGSTSQRFWKPPRS